MHAQSIVVDMEVAGLFSIVLALQQDLAYYFLCTFPQQLQQIVGHIEAGRDKAKKKVCKAQRTKHILAKNNSTIN